jgi:tight adherence protein B
MHLEGAIAPLELVCAMIGANAAFAVYALLASTRGRASFAAYAAALESDLRFLNARWTGLELARAHVGLLVVMLVATVLSESVTLASMTCGVAMLPPRYLMLLRRRRVARLEGQLDTWLTALAHALRANPALGDGLASTARVVAPPLSEELALLLRENALGSPLDRALEDMGRRIDSPVVSTALATLRIARMTGGDFVHTLETSAATLREMARLEGVVRTKTADGRAQAWVVAILPMPMMGTLTQVAPDMLAPLWHSSAGQLLLLGGGAMWLVAILAARRITQVRI